MKNLNEITSEITQIFRTNWSVRNGGKVPEPQDIKLGNDAVKINATVLYADLKESTKMVNEYKKTFSAEVYKSYLTACCELIKNIDGVITSFDGDRVMAVYIGDSKNTNAVKTALQINYMVLKVINPKIKEVYENTVFEIKQVVGIDTSELFVARTGIRGDNDLVWVGNAANMAAKMCAIRDGNFSTFISNEVYERIHESAKFANGSENMWRSYYWPEYSKNIYCSTYYWEVN